VWRELAVCAVCWGAVCDATYQLTHDPPPPATPHVAAPQVGEHDSCGPGNLPGSGFSYSPESFMAARVAVYNFSWRDMGVPSLDKMMDIVQVSGGSVGWCVCRCRGCVAAGGPGTAAVRPLGWPPGVLHQHCPHPCPTCTRPDPSTNTHAGDAVHHGG
jgi:hypothetical protein